MSCGTELFEAIAATNDELLERYLEGGEITTDEALVGAEDGDAGRATCSRSSAARRRRRGGMRALLEGAGRDRAEPCGGAARAGAAAGPGPGRGAEGRGQRAAGGADLQDGDGAARRRAELLPHLQRLGEERPGVWNATQEAAEKVAHISVPQGKERIEVAACCTRATSASSRS
jgi:hypothetical protein